MVEETSVPGIVKREGQEYDLRISFAPYTTALGDRAAMQKQAEQALALVESLPCETAEQYQATGNLLRACKAQTKALETTRKRLTRPILDAKKEVDGWLVPAVKVYSACEKALKAKLVAYQAAHLQKQQETLAAVQTAHHEGDYGAVMQASSELGPVPTVEGVQTRNVWTYDVVNPAAVPRCYLRLNEVAIKEAIRSGAREIPGLKVYQKTTIAASYKNA